MIMSRKIRLGIIAVVVMASVGISAWYLLRQVDNGNSGSVEEVTLGVESSLLPAAVWVSENKGYFREQGLNLTIKEFDSGRLSLLAMLRGDEGVDVCTVAPTPIMFNSFDRQDFSIFATFVHSYDDVKVIARKDVGITTAADLMGKRIGTPSGTTGQFFTEAFLIYNSVSSSDVELVNIAPSDLPSALNDGEVDAIVIWEPHGSNAMRLLGDKGIRLPSSDVYLETFNFVVMNDFASENPEVLERFLRAVVEATEFIDDHMEESQDIVAERLGLDKDVIVALWDEFVFEISLTQSLILTLEDEARWAIKYDLTDKTEVPNYLDYVYLDALDEVKPEAITIIR